MRGDEITQVHFLMERRQESEHADKQILDPPSASKRQCVYPQCRAQPLDQSSLQREQQRMCPLVWFLQMRPLSSVHLALHGLPW